MVGESGADEKDLSKIAKKWMHCWTNYAIDFVFQLSLW